VGLTARTDLGVYLTRNPNANYGFYGAQLQRALLGGASSPWAIAGRGSFVSLYGPEDIDFTVLGAEVTASRTFRLNAWTSVSPYVAASNYLARAHEKTTVVALHDETVPGSQGSLGATLNLRAVRFGAEYNASAVKSISMKVGVGF
jgi:hypothetical protein